MITLNFDRRKSDNFHNELDDLIKEIIYSGRYVALSEAISSVLRLEQQESHDQIVRNAVVEGLESGESPRSLSEIAAERKKLNRV